MSTDALFRISETVRERLNRELNPNPPPPALPRVEVRLTPPSAIVAGNNVLSFWLYQIAEDECSRNAMPVPSAADRHGRSTKPPLRLNLHYLLTPLCATPEEDLRVLGRAMRWFYDNAVFHVSDATGVSDMVRLSVLSTKLEDLTHVWEALRQDYRLSVSYILRTARIDPAELTATSRVLVAEGNVGEQLLAYEVDR